VICAYDLIFPSVGMIWSSAVLHYHFFQCNENQARWKQNATGVTTVLCADWSFSYFVILDLVIYSRSMCYCLYYIQTVPVDTTQVYMNTPGIFLSWCWWTIYNFLGNTLYWQLPRLENGPLLKNCMFKLVKSHCCKAFICINWRIMIYFGNSYF